MHFELCGLGKKGCAANIANPHHTHGGANPYPWMIWSQILLPKNLQFDVCTHFSFKYITILYHSNYLGLAKFSLDLIRCFSSRVTLRRENSPKKKKKKKYRMTAFLSFSCAACSKGRAAAPAARPLPCHVYGWRWWRWWVCS